MADESREAPSTYKICASIYYTRSDLSDTFNQVTSHMDFFIWFYFLF